MQTGNIRRLIRYQGYGLIRCKDGRDILFHRNDLKGLPFNSLRENQSVRFNISLSRKGFQAYDIELIN